MLVTDSNDFFTDSNAAVDSAVGALPPCIYNKVFRFHNYFQNNHCIQPNVRFRGILSHPVLLGILFLEYNCRLYHEHTPNHKHIDLLHCSMRLAFMTSVIAFAEHKFVRHY